MTGEITLNGIVLLSAPINEYDNRVVLLTKERGKITAFAKGAKRPKSRFSASTRPFSFGEFILYEGKTAYNMVSARIENYFEDITNDMERIYYGFYFLEVAEYFGVENVESKDMLFLLYQSLRALIHPRLDNRLVRRIYELKMLQIQGEYPDVFACSHCRNKEKLNGFSAGAKGMLCENCGREDKIQLQTSSIYTMQYVITSPIGKLFNFSVSEEVLRELGMVLNRFYAVQVEKQFHSLEMLEIV